MSVTVANSSAVLRGTYTIMMVDAGPPGADQSHGQRRHWLVNGATIPGVSFDSYVREDADCRIKVSANSNVSMVGATVVTQYIPPNPPVGDGPHRLVSCAQRFTRKKG